MREPTTVLNPLEQLAMEYAGKWKFIMNEPVNYTQSRVRLETDGKGFRLHCDYAVSGLDEARREILMRRALAILAQEEKRIYELSDATALAELDACKLQDGTVHVAEIR